MNNSFRVRVFTSNRHRPCAPVTAKCDGDVIRGLAGHCEHRFCELPGDRRAVLFNSQSRRRAAESDQVPRIGDPSVVQHRLRIVGKVDAVGRFGELGRCRGDPVFRGDVPARGLRSHYG